jgi:hypothetical protein
MKIFPVRYQQSLVWSQGDQRRISRQYHDVWCSTKCDKPRI